MPLIGITSGRCYAGNASLLGICDVVIATKGSNIGMGGPAMVEGGGLGIFRPEEIGPLEVHIETASSMSRSRTKPRRWRVAKKYLVVLPGLDSPQWSCADQRLLRRVIPENRLRVYDIRELIRTLADTDSVLELRPQFGHGDDHRLHPRRGASGGRDRQQPDASSAGAIDSDGSDKAARFIQLCDAFDVPMFSFATRPASWSARRSRRPRWCGILAAVRHRRRTLTVPVFTRRSAQGLRARRLAMAGGELFDVGVFTVAWPTGEFGGMGLEGAVKLGYRNELAAIADPAAPRPLRRDGGGDVRPGRAINHASHFVIDDVIDPAETRNGFPPVCAPRPSRRRVLARRRTSARPR